MGAVTVAVNTRGAVDGGVARSVIATVTWSSSYAANGDTYTPSQFGMTTILAIDPLGAAAGAAGVGYVVGVDITNKKLLLYGGAASGVGLAQTTGDQSGTTCRVLVHGDFPYV